MKIKIFIFLFFIFSVLKSQTGTWKSYTNMSETKMLAAIGDTIWVATNGGVYSYAKKNNSFSKLTNTDGLSSNNVTAIAVDKNKNIWMGHSTGAIDIYSPKTGNWKQIKDILLSSRTQKAITNFYSIGDTMLISTIFGVSIFNIEKFEFGDTYSNFANSTSTEIISALISDGRVFIATNKNIIVSKLGSINLVSPDSWIIGLADINPIGIKKFNNKIFVAATEGVFKFENESWNKIQNINQTPVAIASNDTSLIVVDSIGISFISKQFSVSFLPFTKKRNITSIAFDEIGNIIIGAKDGINYFTLGAQSWKMISPNGPASNIFYDVVVDENSVVWTASGLNTGKGFSSFDGVEWKNFTNAWAFKILLGPNNIKLISTFGGGIYKVNSKNEIEKVFNHIDPGFVGEAKAVTQIIPTGIAYDNEGNLWVLIFQSSNYKILWKLNQKDSTWESFSAPSIDNYIYQSNLLVDKNGTKWMGSAMYGFVPLVTKCTFFNEKINIAGTSDNWGLFSESNGLTSSQVSALAIDKDDELWLATSSGVTIIRDTRHPTQQVSKVYYGAVRDLPINTIAIDALNNKWLGTQKGVFVLSPDGNSLIASYDVQSTNGKLIDNDVNVISFDKKKGIVYFGTAKGLSSLEILTVEPEEEFSKLKISPNPFIVNQNQSVMIRGLVSNSNIKIFSIYGSLITEFAAQGGGRAFWDGKDSNGKLVASGIYFVVAYSDDGTKIAKSKIAVIKK